MKMSAVSYPGYPSHQEDLLRPNARRKVAPLLLLPLLLPSTTPAATTVMLCVEPPSFMEDFIKQF